MAKLKDAQIREPLFEYLEEHYGKVRIIEEKQMGKSRADILMVTQHALYGIEIKSDADTYVRLERQVKDYDRYYDYNMVAVGSSHALHVGEHIPPYWGILSAEETGDGLDFYVVRQPQKNPKARLKKKLELLWRPELVQLQAFFQMPKYTDRSKKFVIQSILERTKYPQEKKGYIPLEPLHDQISELLFERDYNAIAEVLQAYKEKKSSRYCASTSAKGTKS